VNRCERISNVQAITNVSFFTRGKFEQLISIEEPVEVSAPGETAIVGVDNVRTDCDLDTFVFNTTKVRLESILIPRSDWQLIVVKQVVCLCIIPLDRTGDPVFKQAKVETNVPCICVFPVERRIRNS